MPNAGCHDKNDKNEILTGKMTILYCAEVSACWLPEASPSVAVPGRSGDVGAGGADLSICSCMADSPTLPPVPIKNFVDKLIAINVMANPQVAFSRKSPVRCTPMTWLEPPKVEDRPPPLGFCTRITIISKRQTMIARTIKNAYMIYRNSFPQFLNKACKVRFFFWESQT